MHKVKFTTRLRICREKKNISLTAAAAKIGVPKSTLSRWERAERTPSARYWPSIRRVIGVEVNRNTLAPLPLDEAAA